MLSLLVPVFVKKNKVHCQVSLSSCTIRNWAVYGLLLTHVYCSAIVDGGASKSMNSVVIGVHQFKERILEFDISRS
ncbi:hypothetical protein C5167_024920 [Papaver somniferum]|uniref:Xylanase inhibitor C-terminal domain-containing protein n=1 Tax=Papaver somniferum TaxID=3469 RepID=A0A4Y7JRL2_PAPSO|nr:hypothetical protein C5167_024920 [Papaver somniferum]